MRHFAVFDMRTGMEQGRIDKTLARIEAALARIAAAQDTVRPSPPVSPSGSARVIELVNTHEKLREEVADTLRDLDALIEQLEG